MGADGWFFHWSNVKFSLWVRKCIQETNEWTSKNLCPLSIFLAIEREDKDYVGLKLKYCLIPEEKVT